MDRRLVPTKYADVELLHTIGFSTDYRWLISRISLVQLLEESQYSYWEPTLEFLSMFYVDWTIGFGVYSFRLGGGFFYFLMKSFADFLVSKWVVCAPPTQDEHRFTQMSFSMHSLAHTPQTITPSRHTHLLFGPRFGIFFNRWFLAWFLHRRSFHMLSHRPYYGLCGQCG